MDEKLSLHQRRSIRLPHFNYSDSGAYFITIISHNRVNIFGDVKEGYVVLSPIGCIVQDCWCEIPSHFTKAKVNVDHFIVMPNHIHGILFISNDRPVGATHESPLRHVKTSGPPHGSYGAIIGLFKASVTKRIHQAGISSPKKIWQRNYYEHTNRDEGDFQNIVEYIKSNPANWEKDSEFSPVS